MSDLSLSIHGIEVPRFIYGTAWKEDHTQRLVELALHQGFRGIDTANQRKHYDEAAVGHALESAFTKGVVNRADLFLQTKFTFRTGQDHRLPYNPADPIGTQVELSFASSLEHLETEYVDSYLLHGPSTRAGLAPADWAAWEAMQAIHGTGRARLIGVSNIGLDQLQLLCRNARIRPSVVQNRCFATQGWDRQVREFCATNGIVYQGFSLLTANRDVLVHSEVERIADRHGRTASQVIFRFALDVGIVPLTGTTNALHMQADLQVFDFRLSPEEISLIERISQG